MVDKDFIKKAKKYHADVYKDYGDYIYQPMAEATSLGLPVTLGCSYNKCLYCDLNHGIDFKVLSLEDIEDRLVKLSFINKYNRRKVRKFVLLGANPLVLETDYLLEISRLVQKYFKDVKYISSFTRVDDILGKSPRELRLLRENGYNRFSLGIESGSDLVLDLQKKAVSSRDNLEAMLLLEEMDIDYSSYIMLGLGGRKYSRLHAIETAELLSQVRPFELTLVTMVLFKDAPLIKSIRDGSFKRLSPLESLREEKLLLENLSMKNTVFNASHKTNILPLKGILPSQKTSLINRLELAIKELEDEDLGRYEHRRWNKWSTE